MKRITQILILVFIFSLISNSVYSQKLLEFYEIYRQGNELRNKGEYKEAEKKYDKAISIGAKDTYFYVDVISVKLRLKKDKEAKKILKDGILMGTIKDQLNHDSLIVKKFRSDSSWNKLYDVYRQKYNSSIPFQEERLRLMVLIEKDQAVRNLMQYFQKNKRDSIIHAQDIQDSKEMYEIVNKIGFPDREKVGQDAMGAMYILLLHLLNDGVNDKEELAYFEPMIKASVLKGTFTPFWMGILVDRSNVISGIKQTYGCYWEMSAKGERVITPIDNIKEVDKRREAIGLPKLIYSKKDGLILPIDYEN